MLIRTSKRTSLWGTKVFSRSRGSRTTSTGLLDAQSTALKDFTLEALLSTVGLLQSGHLDESESTGLLAMRIQHDLAFFNITILGKETGHIVLSETRVNSSHEKIGTSISGTIGRRATVSSTTTTTAATVATTLRCIGCGVKGTTVIRS